MKINQGVCLLSGHYCDEHIELAKQYIQRNGLLPTDIELKSDGKEILIITKKEVELRT